MNNYAIFFLGIGNLHKEQTAMVFQSSGISNLTTALCIKRCFTQHNLILFLTFCAHLTVFDDLRLYFKIVIAYKVSLQVSIHHNPIACIYSRSCP
ncbi:hypothetical protein D3C85_1434710 [compost metagenome]